MLVPPKIVNKEKLNYCIPVTFSKRYAHQIILEPPFLCDKRYRLPFGKLEQHSGARGSAPRRYFVANGDGFNALDGCVAYHWNITLPDRFRLSDIENIEVRLGRVNPKDIQFIFFE